MLSDRRNGSAWPFARTRIAWSRGDAPAAMRRPISAAIQSASSDPVAKASRRTGAGCGVLPFGAESLADARTNLEAIRIVEPDQPIGGIEDRGLRAVVPAEHDRPGGPVPVAEPEDVVDRGAPERVDGLVVVADDRHVAMRLGEQPDELGLGTVRVLELVDEDVPEPAGDLGSGRGRLADESQGERHLVAEVDAAVRREERLVGGIGARELVLSSPLLGGGVRRVTARLLDRRARGRDGIGDLRRLGRDPVGVLAVGGGADVLVLAPAEQGREGGQEPGRDRQAAGTASSSNSKRCSRRKMTTSGRVRTRRSVGRPSSRAYCRMRPSPKAWNVEIAVSV